MEIALPRGVRDYNPSEAMLLERSIEKVESVFRRFGFYPIDTPSIESTAILNAKAYGEESTGEMYLLKDGDEGLRFDFTVPLARYMAMNKDVPLPFKRYQIGKVWRRDEPQKMRHREFIQADVDIVGSTSVESEAEVIAAAATALESLGMRDYTVFINSRKIIDAVLESFGIPKEKSIGVIRAIDKLQKQGHEGVVSQIASLGIEQRKADEVLNFLEMEGKNDEKLDKMESSIAQSKEEVSKIRKLISLLSLYGLAAKLKVDLTLARGLDYYTGTIFEFAVMQGNQQLPSICGGGRYDNLVGIYSKKNIPAVGITVGISRIIDLMEGGIGERTYAKAFVAYIDGANAEYALSVANKMRAFGINTDFEVMGRSIAKQLEYVNALKIRFAIIIGDIERNAGKVKLRDMLTGKEETLTLEEAVEAIKAEEL